jgi:hypothetical protein
VKSRIRLAVAVAVTGALVVAGTAALAGGPRQVRAFLHGYEEVPAVSTVADGSFRATVAPSASGLAYRLTYSGLEGTVTQAHIHFGQRGVNGGISVWLCGTTTNPGPDGTPACPPSGTVEGTIEASDVVGPGPTPTSGGQGIAPGEIAELMRAIRAGVTYANVHSTKFPGGEIRGQVRAGWGHGRD